MNTFMALSFNIGTNSIKSITIPSSDNRIELGFSFNIDAVVSSIKRRTATKMIVRDVGTVMNVVS